MQAGPIDSSIGRKPTSVVLTDTESRKMPEEKFGGAGNIKEWLKGRDVPDDVAAAVAPALFGGCYFYPRTLVNIPTEDLRTLGISKPHSNLLYNALQQQQQQDAGESIVVLVFLYPKCCPNTKILLYSFIEHVCLVEATPFSSKEFVLASVFLYSMENCLSHKCTQPDILKVVIVFFSTAFLLGPF